MTWGEVQTSLGNLRRRYADGLEIRAEAELLKEAAQLLATDCSIPEAKITRETALLLRRKAGLIRDQLTVGELAIPEDADEQIKNLVSSTATRIIGNAVAKETRQKIDAYIENVVNAQRRADELSVQLRTATSVVEILRAYLELLDSVCPEPTSRTHL